jgi:SAM-dependent methyltransferase
MFHPFFRRCFPQDVHHVAGLHQEIAAALPIGPSRILDLGCGSNADFTQYRSPRCEVWGCDFVRHPQLQYPEWFRQLPPTGQIPFLDGLFDVVCSIMVLEHVENPQAFLAEVSRVLKPGGRFIGHTISAAHYVTWLRRGLGLFPHSWNQQLVERLYGRQCVDTFPAWYRLNSERAIRNNCSQTGLRLAQLRRYADPGYFRFHPLLMGGAIVMDRFCESLYGGGRLYFTVVLQKQAEAARMAA